MTEERKLELAAEYERLIHAVQSGVAVSISLDGGGASPKHLRVGLNARASDHAGLVDLLIAAGVISEEQYLVAINVRMAKEIKIYERLLTE